MIDFHQIVTQPIAGTPYRTYVWGREAMLLDLPKWARPYRSNWRVLHVDGFEASLLESAAQICYRYSVAVATRREL
jgi:hypothetical protein